MSITHQSAKTSYVRGPSATYAYRRFGSKDGVPLLFLHHFRASMDYWDPLLINSIATTRLVILVDNAGVGMSTGSIPDNVTDMAASIIDFIAALELTEVDVFGFSLGGYVGQLVALNAPKGVIRRLVLAGTGPSAGEGVADHTAERQSEIAKLAGGPSPAFEDIAQLFFAPSSTSQSAARAYWSRIHERDVSTSGEERSNVVSHGYADGGVGLKAMATALQTYKDPLHRDQGSFDRLADITIPVLIGQGHDDFMIPTQNSFRMQQRLPNARLKIFPDSGHGFLYQFAEEFARDVLAFLSLA